MFVNTSQIVEKLDLIWASRDPRVEGMLLMDSSKPMIILILMYLSMVYVGPILMKKRQPLNVAGLMLAYNLVMVVLSIYIVAQFLIGAIRLRYNWMCDAYNPLTVDDETFRMIHTIQLYMLTKVFEWLDTFFFIIRKKDQQLSFLHVYHHFSIFLFTWIVFRFVPSGSTFFPLFINSFVHIIMYAYYALAAFGTKFEKYLWWKKYLTLLQLTQFTALFVHLINQIRMDCGFPVFLQLLAIAYAMVFFILFSLFYKSTYKKNMKQNTQILRKTSEANELIKTFVSNKLESVLQKENLRQRSVVGGF